MVNVNEGLKLARQAAGSSAALARAVGLSREAVRKWRSIPAEYAPAIEESLGRRIKCEALCPDVTWHRDNSGAVTGYTIPVAPAAPTEKVA